MKNKPALKLNNGSVLVISLLVLLVLTILGVTALDTTVMEERMSSNTRQRNLAQQAAETALKDAEKWLTNTAGNVVIQSHIKKFTGTAELYDSTVSGRSLNWDVNDSNAWDANNSRAVTSLSAFPNDASIVPGAPRFIIEYVGRVGDPPLNFTDPDLREFAFRVVAIGWGPDKDTKVVLSSTYSKRLS
ncbi:MAG: PilX N-terminal domain-containing pilus assembly protein [Gammaproteobacteria bacterium]|jgi:type IV pilus assembly protein PilX